MTSIAPQIPDSSQNPVIRQTITEVRDYVVAEFLPEGEPVEITGDMDLLNSGIVDSLGLLKLIAWLENAYEITVGDADLDPENFSSLGTIAEFVEDRREPLAGQP